MKKNLFDKNICFQKKEESRSCCLPYIPSHFLYFSCPFLSLDGLLLLSLLTFPSRLYPSLFFLSHSISLLFFSLTHLFRSLYRLMFFLPFLRSPLMPFCAFTRCASSRFWTVLFFLRHFYNLRVYKHWVCNPIETRRHKNLLCAAYNCPFFIHFLCISVLHWFIMNLYVLIIISLFLL